MEHQLSINIPHVNFSNTASWWGRSTILFIKTFNKMMCFRNSDLFCVWSQWFRTYFAKYGSFLRHLPLIQILYNKLIERIKTNNINMLIYKSFVFAQILLWQLVALPVTSSATQLASFFRVYLYEHFSIKKAKVTCEMRVKIHSLNIRGLLQLSSFSFKRAVLFRLRGWHLGC